MKTVRTITKVNAIVHVVVAIICLCGVFLFFGLGSFIQSLVPEAESIIDNAGNHDLTGGYEVLVGIAGVFGGIIGAVLAFVLGVMCMIGIIYFLVPSLISFSNLKKTKTIYLNEMRSGLLTAEDKAIYFKKLRTDSIMNTIINGIPAVFCFIGFIGDSKIRSFADFIVLLGILGICALTGFSIYQTKLCNDYLK